MAERTETAESAETGFGDTWRDLLAGPFGRLVLPALILQSVLIGGGYSTGREIVAYGGRFGAAGWISIVAIWLGFTVMAVASFELARVFEAYDYKSWIKQLIWKGWPLFDLLFLVMAVLVIAIMASAAGNILEQTVGIPYLVGITIVIAIVAVLTYFGASLIEEFKTFGSSLLYLGYIAFGVIVLSQVWGDVTATFATWDTSYVDDAGLGATLEAGILYVGYNLVVYPAVFFTLHRQRSRRDTVISGVLAGVLMTLPFLLTYLALMGFYPSESVMGAEVPWLPMLQAAGGGWIVVLYGIVVGWTLVETSVGLIHALVDRIDENIGDLQLAAFEGREGLTRLESGALGAGILLGALLLSRVGIITLVAQGYTIMAYFFIALFAIPLLTVGLYRIAHPEWRARLWEQV